jgi:hypothetical protein
MGRPSIGFHPPAVPREIVEESVCLLVSTHVPSAGGGVQVEIGLSTYAAALQRNGSAWPFVFVVVSLLFSLVRRQFALLFSSPPVCQAGLRAGSINVFEWFCSQKGHGRAGLARSSMTARTKTFCRSLARSETS